MTKPNGHASGIDYSSTPRTSTTPSVDLDGELLTSSAFARSMATVDLNLAARAARALSASGEIVSLRSTAVLSSSSET